MLSIERGDFLGIVSKFEETYLGMTAFRRSFSTIINNLESPKIVMSGDTPKVVLVPYEEFKAMEEIIEEYNDLLLSKEIEERLLKPNSDFTDIDQFFGEVLSGMENEEGIDEI